MTCDCVPTEDVADATGLTPRQIRYWVELGIVDAHHHATKRGSSGYSVDRSAPVVARRPGVRRHGYPLCFMPGEVDVLERAADGVRAGWTVRSAVTRARVGAL